MNFFMSVLALGSLGYLLGLGLGWALVALQVDSDSRVDDLEAMLPGGQCGQCGLAGCRQAAQAMVEGSLSADTCPPGGAGLAQAIATFLGVSVGESQQEVTVARITEAQCTGCTRCFKACPFDAIVGANRQMHTVLKDICTGCRLCEKACQSSCIEFVPVPTQLTTWLWPKPHVA